MARTFDIFERGDFEKAVLVFQAYFDKREREGKPFQKIKLISKRWRAPKTSKQHAAYWRCVSELKKAFIQSGVDTNEDEVHEFVKRRSGFTKMLGDTMITKSIADASDHATNENLRHLIDFMIRFAAESLDYQIKIGEDDIA